MKSFVLACLLFLGFQGQAQVTRVSLQASGLTCSMCSKAVKTAIEKVAFVDKVQVDIKNQQYNISFRDTAAIDLDALTKAVEDAGFSVASFRVTADVNGITVGKDQHIRIGSSWFHFLNAANQQLNGSTSFTIVDKGFVPVKEAKKYQTMSKMKCVQTGKAGSCCTEMSAETRIYHAII